MTSRTTLGKIVTPPGRDWAAFTLAIGLATAVNMVTVAVLINALSNTPDVGLSENATQLLTNAFSGIVGLLGSYIGFRAGAESRKENGESGEHTGDVVQVVPLQQVPETPQAPGKPGLS